MKRSRRQRRLTAKEELEENCRLLSQPTVGVATGHSFLQASPPLRARLIAIIGHFNFMPPRSGVEVTVDLAPRCAVSNSQSVPVSTS